MSGGGERSQRIHACLVRFRAGLLTNIGYPGFEFGDLGGRFCELGFEFSDLGGRFCELGFEFSDLGSAFCELAIESGDLVGGLRCLLRQEVLFENEICPAVFMKAEFPREHDEQPGSQDEDSGWKSVGQSKNKASDDYGGVDTADRGEVPPSEYEVPLSGRCLYCHLLTLGAERDCPVKRSVGDPFVLAHTPPPGAMALSGPA